MKRNLTLGIVLFSAIALSSCSTQDKLVSAKNADDVYFTKAKAGDEPVYAAANSEDTYRHDNNANTDRANDYYYYDSYESRLNRFYGYSPYGSSYYSSAFYGYSPYTSIGLGLGLGYGAYGYYGYSPYSYGYSPFGYSPYNYGGYGGYGYGGGSYWGPYSYYNTVPGYGTSNVIVTNPRQYRGSGLPGTNVGGANSGYTGYGSAGSYPPANRPTRTASNNPNGSPQVVSQRPSRTTTTQQQAPQQQYTPPPSSNNNSGSSSSGSSSSGSTSAPSGGGRAARP